MNKQGLSWFSLLPWFTLKMAFFISIGSCMLLFILSKIFATPVTQHQFSIGALSNVSLWHAAVYVSVLFGSVFLIAYFAINRFINRCVTQSAYSSIEELKGILVHKRFEERLASSDNALQGFIAKPINQLLEALQTEIENRLSLARLRLEDQMIKSRLSQNDPLTGLPNRQYFTQTLKVHLKKAQDNDANPALILIDLLEFKTINDVYGITMGDEVLVAVAKRMQEFAVETGAVGRLSSDEFLIFVTKPMSETDLLEYASGLVAKVSRPYQVQEYQINIEMTCGVAYAKDAKFVLSDLLANVDIAQQFAKLKSTQGYCLFVDEMKAQKMREQLIVSSIKDGLDAGDFEVFYQAKVNSEGQIIGFEALARWHSKTLGVITPGEFIPMAEKSGKISLITNWIINQTFADLPLILAKTHSDLRISINLSAHDLKSNSLMAVIEKCMLVHNVAGKNIEFEITESSFLENLDRVNTIFDQLRSKGCQLALDDFGTGYSSLSYLTKIKVNVLKLDKQFVDELAASSNGEVITECIVAMAHQLQMEVCAEGVESLAQAQMLVDIGCEQLQGYYFSVPAPLSKHLQLLDAAQTKTEKQSLVRPIKPQH